MIDDPYKILGVSPSATDEEIKQAYRRLAKQYHPDRNPGDEEAARKMQEINAAYEAIKDPAKAQGRSGGYNTYGGYGYDGQGRYGYGGPGSYQASPEQYMQAAEQYIRYGRFREALMLLSNISVREARWYYLSALANDGLGNQVTALEHMRKAVSMEPDNPAYLAALEELETGGSLYRRRAGTYRTYHLGDNPCIPFFLCWCLQWFCCRC
jgi:molecular chaperone DnaJ